MTTGRGAAVDTATAGELEVHSDIGVRVGLLLSSYRPFGAGVDQQEGFHSTAELLDVVTTEGIDHRGTARRLTTARMVRVRAKHALDGAGLEAVVGRAASL